MDEVGINIRGHTSDSLRKYMEHMHFNYAITVCSHTDQHCPHALGSQGVKLHWPFDDPAAIEGGNDDKQVKFREVRDQIAASIQEWTAKLD